MRPSGTVVVVPFRDDLAQYFAALNREWIEHYVPVSDAHEYSRVDVQMELTFGDPTVSLNAGDARDLG
jgi:hypothetical protein